MSRKKRKPLAANFFDGPPQPLQPFYTALRVQHGGEEERVQYPYNIPALRALEKLELHPKITFFIGENGSGKSTLLEAIAISLHVNPEGGSQNFRFATRAASHTEIFLPVELEQPPRRRRPTDIYFLRAESFFNVASELERLDEDPPRSKEVPPLINAYGGKSLHEQSHGESFFALLDRRFHGDGFYLLDEPEAALSPSRQMTMLAILHRHISDGSQFVIATHSPILMAYPDATIYSFTATGIERVEYEQTEHFRVTRDFLNRREKMLAILLSDES